MFKKIVSSLPFSPALVGQLGFYAKRLKKEEATRKMGLILTALALVVQSFAVFQPPENANAASSNDMIYGGYSTRDEYVNAYDSNTNNIKDLFNAIGISRTDIQNAQYGEWNSHTNGGYSWGRLTRFSYAQGERAYTFPTANGSTTFYYRPLSLSDTLSYTIANGSTYEALIGKTAKGMDFALLKLCGNLVLKVAPPAVPCPSGMTGTYPNCTTPPKMCDIQGKTNLLASDPNCKIDMCTIAGKTNLPASDPNCKIDMCTIQGKTNLLASDPNCKVTVMCTVTGKTSLPATDPGCVAPKMCDIQGKTNLLASDPNCKIDMCTIAGKTNLPASDPNCKVDAVASCQSLTIDKIASNYQFTTTAAASNGATVSKYQYVIKRDGQVITTQTIDSNQLSNIYVYNQTKEGAYTVEVSIITSAGIKTSPDCVKTFSIAAPQMCAQNTKILAISPECQPCPGDSLLWIKDEKCAATLVQTKSATNMTQNSVDAQTVTAKANDKIVYKLTVENTGKAPADYTIVERTDDLVEYANIIDYGGGSKGEDPDTKTAIMTWPKFTVKPGEKVTRMFTVQVMSTIPALAKSSSNPTSYDCRMTNTFGNNVTIAVDCPLQKQAVETVTAELPHTGPSTSMLIGGIALAVVAYFYARSRQLKTEIRLIRRDFNTGTL